MEELEKEIKELEILITKAKEEDNIKTDTIIKQLQAINDLFLTKYNIKIEHNDKSVIIIPIETEIYFSNIKVDLSKDVSFYDGMCHRNKLQKNNFGKLYFHRYGIDKNSGVKCAYTNYGGLDICISQGDYYLSILIRSAFINGMKPKNIESGINKICKKIVELFKPEEQKCLECFLRELEKENGNVNVIVSRDSKTDIDTNNIYHQQRISGDHYFKEDEQKEYELNSLNLGEKDKDGYKYLNIIKTKQTFYKKGNNIKQIIENFKKQQIKKV